MAAPPNLEHLEGRCFAFYPPIRNVDHNEWALRRAEWSELLVANSKTGQEVWVPRRYVGEVSDIDEPVLIVGLTRELEFKMGAVWPFERRVLAMPRTVDDTPHRTSQPPAPAGAPAHGEVTRPPSAERSAARLILGVLLVGVIACLAVIAVFLAAPLRPVKFTALDQDFLSLSRDDDYHSVLRKLGAPAETRWRSQGGDLEFEALWYPQRSYHVILFGADRASVRYIGALDRNWHVVHSVPLPNGADTASMLRSLPKF